MWSRKWLIRETFRFFLFFFRSVTGPLSVFVFPVVRNELRYVTYVSSTYFFPIHLGVQVWETDSSHESTPTPNRSGTLGCSLRWCLSWLRTEYNHQKAITKLWNSIKWHILFLSVSLQFLVQNSKKKLFHSQRDLRHNKVGSESIISNRRLSYHIWITELWGPQLKSGPYPSNECIFPLPRPYP